MDTQVDPLSHEITMPRWRWARTAVLALTVAPIRMVLFFIPVILMWVVASVALWGITDEELNALPLRSWRSQLKEVMRKLGRLALRLAGFSVTVRGKRASSAEAPILALAPHSTFCDAIAALWGGAGERMPYVVSRTENLGIPVFGKIIRFMQAVGVSREDPDSRRKAKEEIIRRADSRLAWPQLMIFPEGSTSNRKSLMTFAPGAFNPGRTVQPVVLRYPNVVDTVTWTWNQPHGALSVFWHTLSQPFTRAEMEFLPPYHPSEEELRDPKLFASNVRSVMAKGLGIPESNVSFKEAKEKYGRQRSKSSKRA